MGFVFEVLEKRFARSRCGKSFRRRRSGLISDFVMCFFVDMFIVPFVPAA